MKKRNLLSFLLVLTLVAGLLTGCGASSKGDAGVRQNFTMAAPKEAMAEEIAMDEMEAGRGALADGQDTAATPLPENRKWVVTMNISAETDDLDTMSASLAEKIEALDGYVEDQRVYNGTSRQERRYRNASLTIRIPADQVDRFTQEVAGIANVVSKEKNLEDITLRYVATESRLTALETEEARLLELLAQAENMADLLEIEARLTDVRYELENAASQMRLYNNQIDYATIYLYIEEVQEYTPVEEPTVWERIRDGFAGSLKGLGKGTVNLLVWIIASSPYLLVLGAVITGIVLLVKRRKKNHEVKKDIQENKE